MFNNIMLNNILSAIGGAGVVLVIVVFLGKRFLELQISKATEKYKFELDQKSASLKTELSIYAHEQNVGLSRLDEQRSQAIMGIYALITEWHEIYKEIAKPYESEHVDSKSKKEHYHELFIRIIEVAEAISIKVRDSAIFFDKDSFEKIAGFGKGALGISRNFLKHTFDSYDYQHNNNDKNLFFLIEGEREKLKGTGLESMLEGSLEILITEFRKLMKADRTIAGNES